MLEVNGIQEENKRACEITVQKEEQRNVEGGICTSALIPLFFMNAPYKFFTKRAPSKLAEVPTRIRIE